jgi:hypothetical protein
LDKLNTTVANFIPFDIYTDALTNIKTKALKVEYILEHFPETRNNDNYLCNLYWKLVDGIKELDDVIYATSPEVLRRARQKIQNEQGKYLPTDPDVRKKRRIAEIAIRQNIHKI